MSGGLSVAEVLSRAADLIEPKGAWSQRGYNPRAGCYCALGAIVRAGAGKIEANWTHPSMRLPKEAAERLFGDLRSVVDFNDAPERTQAEVVAKLREAARRTADGEEG